MDTNRYYRNTQIADFGEEGQRKLQHSKVLVIGAGGLGSPVLFYLAAAGVGTLGVVDDDVVNVSNLQRQILYCSDEIGLSKVRSVEEKLKALNPEVHIVTYDERFTPGNATALVRQYDFIVDCCDNFETKFLINDVCVAEQKPYSHGAVLALRGEVMTYIPGSADYRQLFDQPTADDMVATSNQVGILGAVAGIVGSIQATEVIKYLTGIGALILNRILIVDGESMNFHSFRFSKANN